METPVTDLIEDIIEDILKAVEAKAGAAHPEDIHLASAREVGHLQFLLKEALRLVPRRHLADVAERYDIPVPQSAIRNPQFKRTLGLRLTR